MKRVSLLFALLCVSVAGTMASEINHDDPWNPHHIDGLPADIRHYIAGICRGDARAQHDFATYNPSEKRWRINLEYLSCPGLEGYRKGNQCLDVDFIELGSHFRLARKEFRSCGFWSLCRRDYFDRRPAGRFVEDMRAYFAERNAIKRDEIAGRQMSVLRRYQGPWEKPLRIPDTKEILLQMRDQVS